MMNEQLYPVLRERLDTLQTLWLARDARAIVEQLYTDETQITGPGADPLYRGTAQLTELVNALVSDSREATIRIDHVQPLTEEAAYTWVTWQVQPNEGDIFNMKSLFVWLRIAGGWRILADMYAEGEVVL